AFNSFKVGPAADLKEAITQWRQQIRSYLEVLKSPNPGISAPVQAVFVKRVDDEVMPVINSPPLDTEAAAAAELVRALRNTVIARRRAIEVFDKLHQAIENELTEAKRI